MSAPSQPIQPVILDENRTTRCKANEVVRYLIDQGSIDMNHLARIREGSKAGPTIPLEDWAQFHELLGYSVSGLADLQFYPDDRWKHLQNQSEILLGRAKPTISDEQRAHMLALIFTGDEISLFIRILIGDDEYVGPFGQHMERLSKVFAEASKIRWDNDVQLKESDNG